MPAERSASQPSVVLMGKDDRTYADSFAKTEPCGGLSANALEPSLDS